MLSKRYPTWIVDSIFNGGLGESGFTTIKILFYTTFSAPVTAFPPNSSEYEGSAAFHRPHPDCVMHQMIWCKSVN